MPSPRRKTTRKTALLGGCLCGRLRYRVALPPVDAAYCHCRLCRRSAGAPVLAWASFPGAAFRYVKGEPRVYRSSRKAMRDFCGDCGTQLTFRSDRSDEVDVTLASLDEPRRIVPEYHIWTMSRVPWFDTRDALPRHRGSEHD